MVGLTQQGAQSSNSQPASGSQRPTVRQGSTTFGLGSLFQRNNVALNAAPIARQQRTEGPTAVVIPDPVPEEPAPEISAPEPVEPVEPPPGPPANSAPLARPERDPRYNYHDPRGVPRTGVYLARGNAHALGVSTPANPPSPVATGRPEIPGGQEVAVNPVIEDRAPTSGRPTGVGQSAPAPVTTTVAPTGGMPEGFSGGDQIWQQGVESLTEPLPTLSIFGEGPVSPDRVQTTAANLRTYIGQYNWPQELKSQLLRRIDDMESGMMAELLQRNSAPEPGLDPALPIRNVPNEF